MPRSANLDASRPLLEPWHQLSTCRAKLPYHCASTPWSRHLNLCNLTSSREHLLNGLPPCWPARNSEDAWDPLRNSTRMKRSYSKVTGVSKSFPWKTLPPLCEDLSGGYIKIWIEDRGQTVSCGLYAEVLAKVEMWGWFHSRSTVYWAELQIAFQLNPWDWLSMSNHCPRWKNCQQFRCWVLNV